MWSRPGSQGSGGFEPVKAVLSSQWDWDPRSVFPGYQSKYGMGPTSVCGKGSQSTVQTQSFEEKVRTAV
jgi:hypothetical protein